MNADVRDLEAKRLDDATVALGAMQRLLETDGVRDLLRGWSWDSERRLRRVDEALEACAALLDASAILGREPTPAGRPAHLEAADLRQPGGWRRR